MNVYELLDKHKKLNMNVVEMASVVAAYDISVDDLSERLLDIEKRVPFDVLSDILKKTPEAINYI